MFQKFIAGEWLDGASARPNINPSDTRDTIGEYAVTDATHIGRDFRVPFGGRKGSSYGPREQGRYAAEFYTTVKTAYTFAG